MKRRLIKLAKLLAVPFVLWLACFAVSIWLALVVGAVGSIVLAVVGAMWLTPKILNRLIKGTNWWNNQYVGIRQFVSNMGYRDNIIRNYDIVNLGSNPARYAFFYENVVGQSWATGSQGQDMDLELLKYFHSYLKKGGTVLIPIMPFTAISPFIATRKEYWGPAYYSKFYQLLDWEQKKHLPYADEVAQYLSRPLSVNRSAWRYLVRDVSPDRTDDIAEQPMMAAELEQDATLWIKMWCDEFKIKKLADVLDSRWQKYYDEAISINKKIVDFCLERGYKPVFICVPMMRYLAGKFPEDVRKYLVADFVAACNEHNIPFLDYTNDGRFQDSSLYFNSFFLNLRGRKLFTAQVLKDLGLLKK